MLPAAFSVAATVAVTLLSVTLASPVQAALPAATDGEPLPSLAPMLERVTPAVVNISTEGRVPVPQQFMQRDRIPWFFFPPGIPMEREFQSLGSGVIVDGRKGLILTNHHVIENADQVTVTLNDGRTLDGEIVGSDPDTDVAVVRVESKELKELPRGDSNDLRVGDFVVAIGNPFGIGQSVTSGIVSARERSGLSILNYENFIQTDASINFGNSGGALVNLRGELVGINTAIYSNQARGGSIGIGFAIPVNLAMRVMQQLLEYGEVKRGYLGVQVQNVNPDLAEEFKLDKARGAIVSQVLEGSAAEEAGVRPGDIIVSINGKAVDGANDVRNMIGLMDPGEKAVFGIVRDGELLKISAKLHSSDERTSGQGRVRSPLLQGVSLEDSGRPPGVLVVAVERGSPSWRAGLREGDVIVSVNQAQVTNAREFLQRVSGRSRLLLLVRRDNGSLFILLK